MAMISVTAAIVLIAAAGTVILLNNDDGHCVYSFETYRYNCDLFSFDIDGKNLDMNSSVSSGSQITVLEGSEWTQESLNVFTCTMDGSYYSVTIKITGTEYTGSIIDDVPTITLGDVENDIAVEIDCNGL